MCFGCGEEDDYERERPRNMAPVSVQPGSMQMSHSGIDRKREDKEDEELRDAQRKILGSFRNFIEAAAETPAGPRMEHVYQQFRFAIRAATLALEEEPPREQLTMAIAHAFFQRQIDRCQDAQRQCDNAYQLCAQEADGFRQMQGGDAVGEALMNYAKILPTMKAAMADAIVGQTKSRDGVKADMDRIARGEAPLGPSPKIDREREDREDEDLSVPHQRAIKGFRRFIEELANTPSGPRMEVLYQRYRSAIRASALALEEEPTDHQKAPLSIVLTFHERQIARCYEAAHNLADVYQLCVQEAEMKSEGCTPATIMAYAAILDAIKDSMGHMILAQIKLRDDIRAKIEKTH